MGNFSRNNSFRGRDSRPSMHHAVCDECGQDCEVPFKPSGGKPIYCDECFSKKGGGSDSRRHDNRRSGRTDFGDRKMYEVICDSCGEKCEVPFKPSSDKPVYCDSCFAKKGKDNKSSQSAKQLEMISNKLDEIIRLLTANQSSEKKEKVEEKKQTKPRATKIKATKAKIKIAKTKTEASKKKTIKKVTEKNAAKKAKPKKKK